MTNEILKGFKGSSMLDTGYIYAPYIPVLNIPSQEEIKAQTRIPIKIIKAAMNQAKYKINRDFTIENIPWSASMVITSRPGRRFDHHGQCRAQMVNGKLTFTWSYEPTPGSKANNTGTVSVADPNCLPQISEIIVKALKENSFRPVSTGYAKRIHASYYGKVTL